MKTWVLGNHILEFDEESHVYIADGVIVPSVTQILSKKFNDYVGVSNVVLNRAAKLGSDLHKAIELYEKDGIKSDLKEFKNYLFLKKAKGIRNIANEIPIIYEKDGKVLYAGTLDQIIEIDGKDIKIEKSNIVDVKIYFEF